MKIIKIDSFGRETSSDVLVAVNVSGFYAELIVGLLNIWTGENSSDYFQAVADDHKLFVFEP